MFYNSKSSTILIAVLGLYLTTACAGTHHTAHLEDRETPCIALGDCPEFPAPTHAPSNAGSATKSSPPSASSNSPAPSSPKSTPKSSSAPLPKDRPYPLDSAPDFSKDPFPPYPPIKNPDGSKISIANWRGTRLFGWTGCSGPDQQAIAKAFDDFHTLVNIDGVYQNIDWNNQAAKEFWGSVSGKYALNDETHKQIQQIYAAAQQVYNWGWITYPFPGAPFARLWIEVRCSGGDGKGDPDNICRDGTGGDGRCGIPPNRPPTPDHSNRLQAYSDNAGDGVRYSRITFCNGFFSLQKFDDAIDAAKRLPTNAKRNLENWDNQARCFLHEMTHLDYFMNAPGSSPHVSDLTFQYKQKGLTVDADGYGPQNCRILTNYKKQGIGGAYTQRNADTYAWFAMAKYAQKETNSYPDLPAAGNLTPIKPPKDSNGDPIVGLNVPENAPSDDAPLQSRMNPGLIFPPLPLSTVSAKTSPKTTAKPTSTAPAGPPSATPATPPFTIPGCPDSRVKIASNDPLIVVNAQSSKNNETAEVTRVVKGIESAVSTQKAKDSQGAKNTQNAKDSQGAKPTQDTRGAQNAKETESAKDVQSAKPAQDAKDAQNTKENQNAKETQSAKATQSVKDIQPTKNVPRSNSTPYPKCMQGNTVVPSGIFSGPSGTVYDRFCSALSTANDSPLSWNVNLTGFQVDEKAKRMELSRIWFERSNSPVNKGTERTPSQNPDAYPAVQYNLAFTPSGSVKCQLSCKDAYKLIANSPCGLQGSEEDLMAPSGNIDVGCGTYSFVTLGH